MRELKWLAAIPAMATAAISTAAYAEPVAEAAFDLPSLPVTDAVARLRTMGLPVSAAGNATGTTKAVRGRMTLREALRTMLDGTGLAVAWSGGSATVFASGTGDGDEQIGTVRIAGDVGNAEGGGAVVPRGANGSSDPTATERTRSYAATKTNIGGKVAATLREVPQSVTVITRQRIDDQQLSTLTDVLRQTPGVTVLQRDGGSSRSPQFYSRGFEIRNIQIDGGAPISYRGGSDYSSSFTPVFDMSKYDHVEVLRGADGTFTGVGDPGGVLSLERKRATDNRQLLADVSVGSWDAVRASIDLSTPLTADGRLKVRAVATHDRHDFFYRVANSALDMGYVNVEFRPTDATRLNLGGSYTEQSGLSFSAGLPRFADATDAKLPRALCLCIAGVKDRTRELELFAQVEQHLAPGWTINANLTAVRQQTRLFSGVVSTNASGGLDPATDLLQFPASISLGKSRTRSLQYTGDLFVTGAFHLFGREQTLVVGGNYQRQDDHTDPDSSSDYTYPDEVFDVRRFDPRAYALPPASAFVPTGNFSPVLQRTQYAVYGTLNIEPLARLHIGASLRYNGYRTRQVMRFPDFGDGQTSSAKIFNERRFVPPLVSARYDVTRQMSVYASYAGIYQTNADRRTADGGVVLPVTGTNIEAGIKRSDFGGRLTSSISVFKVKQVGLPTPDPSLPTVTDPNGINCCYTNNTGGKQRSTGFDVEIAGALTPRLQTIFGYTHNISKFVQGKDIPPAPIVTQAPKDMVKLFASFRTGTTGLAGRIVVGGGGRFQSKALTKTTTFSGDTPVQLDVVQRSYALLDLFGRVALTKSISLQVNVNNVFDKHYYETIGSIGSGDFYGAPRNVSAVLRGKF